MGLIADLPGGSIGMDTMTFIYLIEEHPTFCPSSRPCSGAPTAAGSGW